MSFNLLIAPDFPPDGFAGWYMLSTLLQRRSGIGLHLLMPADAGEQAALLAGDGVDLIYANPFDAAGLVRGKGYRAVARPSCRADEVVVACRADAAPATIEDLQRGQRVALTQAHDVKLIGLRLLEPADLAEADLRWQPQRSYQAVARQLVDGDADIGFFLADAFHAMSRVTRAQLRVLVESCLHDISHVLLAHPRVLDGLPALRATLLGIGRGVDGAGGAVLDALDIPAGFEAMDDEDVEFMIDLMDTLLD